MQEWAGGVSRLYFLLERFGFGCCLLPSEMQGSVFLGNSVNDPVLSAQFKLLLLCPVQDILYGEGEARTMICYVSHLFTSLPKLSAYLLFFTPIILLFRWR